ncbi:MAG: tail fiber domain-containing protein [Patescibacteria group bacterium]
MSKLATNPKAAQNLSRLINVFAALVLFLTGSVVADAEDGTWSTLENNIFWTNGNVGIGTSTPASALDVQGNFKIGDNTFFVNNLTGNIGIGTTNPQAKLDIKTGDVLIDNAVWTKWVLNGKIRNQIKAGTVNFGDEVILHAPERWDSVRYMGTGTYMLNVSSDLSGATSQNPVVVIRDHPNNYQGMLILGLDGAESYDVKDWRMALWTDALMFAPAGYTHTNAFWVGGAGIKRDADSGALLIKQSGADIVSIPKDKSGMIVNGRILVPAGTITTPSIAFADDTDSGIWRAGNNEFEIALGGKRRWNFGETLFGAVASGGVQLAQSGLDGSAKVRFNADTDTGIGHPALDNVTIITNGKERLRVDPSGKVGIGVSAPTVALDVAGDIQYTGGLTDVSDARLKTNIQDLDSSLAKIGALRPVSFRMKNDTRTNLGFLAQDVQKIFPEAVSTIDTEGHLGLDYTQLIAPTVGAVQELQARVEKLEKLLNEK